MQKMGMSKEEADQFIRNKLRNKFTNLKTKAGGKFILGVTRMYIDGQLEDGTTKSRLDSTLKYVASDAHINEYDRNLNDLSADELIDRFKANRETDLENAKNKINAMQFDEPSEYEIVRIDSFEQACEYNEYTYDGSPWCLTYDEDNYEDYTKGGINQVYFCFKNGFENVQPVQGEGCPLDEYGLSMISVIVDGDGALVHCTSRWNHANGGTDNVMGDEQITKQIKQPFYNVFKPNTKWKDMVDEALQRLKNGEDPRNVFDRCGDFYDGYAVVCLGEKWNWIDKDGNLLSKNQWFDRCGDFHEGYAVVRLGDKRNWIGTECNYVSPNQWFEFCGNFHEGYATAQLNRKANWVDKDGNYLCPNQEFKYCGDFSEGYAAVNLDGKWNWMDKERNLLFPNQEFDLCRNFSEGYAAVSIYGYCNWVNKDGNYLFPNQRFDGCWDFNDGYAKVRIIWGGCDVEDHYIDREGNLYDFRTRRPLGFNINKMKQNESKVGKRTVVRLTESDLRLMIEQCIRKALNN